MPDLFNSGLKFKNAIVTIEINVLECILLKSLMQNKDS